MTDFVLQRVAWSYLHLLGGCYGSGTEGGLIYIVPAVV